MTQTCIDVLFIDCIHAYNWVLFEEKNSIFDSKILYRFPFNEEIKNSLEDSLLSYQLWKSKIECEVIKTNVIHKGNLSFKKVNEKNKLSGYYNFNDWANNLNVINNYIKGEIY